MRTTPTNPAVEIEALNEELCGVVLAEHGLVCDSTSIASLGGGVSNIVLAVECGDRRLVLKQALPRLKVADEWLAPINRVLSEAEALRLASEIAPGTVPEVAFIDDARLILAIESASESWADWKSLLLRGEIDARVAETLGRLLARWQAATSDVSALPNSLRERQRFEMLRVEPYYLTVAERQPSVAASVRAYVEAMETTALCLVHGDFSPKNVLVAPDAEELWVIDFEVAHVGDPAFDVAFLLTHLALKSLHHSHHAGALDACARSFLEAYEAESAAQVAPERSYVFGHIGCLLLARVHGKSPAEYLDVEGRRRADALGRSLLESSPDTLDELFAERDVALEDT